MPRPPPRIVVSLMTETLTGEDRPIRTFHPRRGRMSARHTDAMTALWPFYGLDVVDGDRTPVVPAELFGRDAPCVFEIGFGMGDATAEMAAADPDRDYLAIEVHTPGVGSLLKLIGEQQLQNLRLIQHDAVEVVDHMIAPRSLAGVHVFFPDPWHKARHNKRRLLQPAFVALLASRLAPGGYLHCATDWEDYAVQMLEVLGAEPSLENTAGGYAPRPSYRPVTKFENRGLKLGHGVWDLVFRLRGAG